VVSFDHRQKLQPRDAWNEKRLMRRRFQKGSLKKVGASWIAQWWEDGHRRARTLGRVSKMTKSEANAELAAIVSPVNGRSRTPSARCTFREFVADVYLPFYRRKWKRTTAITNEDRINLHLIPEFGERTLGALQRDELQALLDRKATAGLSFSVVAHLRWTCGRFFGWRLRKATSLAIPPNCFSHRVSVLGLTRL
jgi:hypothetical protein